MTDFIVKIYLKYIRIWLSPLLYWIVRKFIYNYELPNKWNKIKDLDIDSFEKEIDKKYLWDYKNGIIDFSSQEYNFYFIDKRKWFRDCDDTSRMWYWWGVYNDYPTWEVCLWKGFESAHFVTIIKKEDEYILCNYKAYKGFKTLKEAINYIDLYDSSLIYKTNT